MLPSAALPAQIEPQAAPRAPARKRARLWWGVHHWAGLKFSILLSVVLLTGTLATISNEIDWLIRPAARVYPSTVKGPVDWAAIAGQADAHSPDANIIYMDAPIASAFAAVVLIERPDGETAFLYAHPTTGAIQGEGGTVTAQQILRNMHRHLNMPIWLGLPIVASLSVLLLVSLATSLVVYKKWWRGWFKRVRTRNARTGWGDFHRLAGVWSLWFVALMIVTGLWYLIEEVAAPAPPLPEPVSVPKPAKQDELAALVRANLAAAQAAAPDLAIRGVRFPSGDYPVFVFEGQRSAVLVRTRANAVWTGAPDASVLLVTDGRELGVHQRISEAADPLHFGTWGGYPTKILWFLFGLLLTGLAVSGAALHGLRLAGIRDGSGRGRRVVGRAWRDMGIWRWPSLGLVLAAFVLLPGLFAAGG